MIDYFVDSAIKRLYGITLSDAQARDICVSCRKRVGSDKLEDEERVGYGIDGLCPKCRSEGK